MELSFNWVVIGIVMILVYRRMKVRSRKLDMGIVWFEKVLK